MLKIIICDDEAMGLEALKLAINKVIPEKELFAFSTGEEALDFARKNKVDISFLDIELGTTSGIEVGKKIKLMQPKSDVVFCTGYDRYAVNAFELGASDYLMKPISVSEIERALKHLRNTPSFAVKGKLRVQCFGNFEIFIGEEPLRFDYDKTKELFAYLIDRKGSMVSNNEIACALWEDEGHLSYLRSLKKDLLDTLKKYSMEKAVNIGWGAMGINQSMISCDYYDFLNDVGSAVNLFKGEYMSQYSFAEDTLAGLTENTVLK